MRFVIGGLSAATNHFIKGVPNGTILAPIEKEQTPIMIETNSSRSSAKLIRQLFERTQNKLLTLSSDPFNSSLRESVQQWSQKRVFDFMLMDVRRAQWFNLWRGYGNIIDDEFMVYRPMSDNAISKGNDRILLTNKRLVIFTAEKPLRIERQSLLSKSCPPEDRVKALLD